MGNNCCTPGAEDASANTGVPTVDPRGPHRNADTMSKTTRGVPANTNPNVRAAPKANSFMPQRNKGGLNDPMDLPPAPQVDTEDGVLDVPLPIPGVSPAHRGLPTPPAAVVSHGRAPAAPPSPSAHPKAAAVPPPPSAARGGSGTSAQTVSFGTAVRDLAKAEKLAYGSVFASFGAARGMVPLDHPGMREFIVANSGINFGELDTELLKAQEEMQITLDGFVKLLSGNAVSEQLLLERFMGLADSSEMMTAPDCRTGLVMLKEELGIPDVIGEARWEQAMDNILSDLGAGVNMEGWMTYGTQVARLARLCYVAKL